MSTFSRPALHVLAILGLAVTLAAQEPASTVILRSSPVITAASTGDKVRFSAPGNVCQIRVQVVSVSGDLLFESSWRDGNLLDLSIDSAGPLLAGSAYRCVVMVRDLDGQVTVRQGNMTAQDGQLSIERRDGSDGLAVLGSDDSGPRITMLAHDGTNGSLVSTSGDLSFRLGQFLSDKDNERMRLTVDGNLGIGTAKPQAPLDVNGLIRTSKGIMFADGTILTTAGGSLAAGENGATAGDRPSGRILVRGGLGPASLTPSTASRLLPRTTAPPAYQFRVDAVGVHIGNANAFGLDVAGNVSFASNLALPATTNSTAGVVNVAGIRFMHNFGATSNTFVGRSAGNFTLTGAANTGYGFGTLFLNTSGTANTAAGSEALENNTTGVQNTATGNFALYTNDTGNNNVATGFNALLNNTFGSGNTVAGSLAMQANTQGSFNTAIGFQALNANTTGSQNTATGRQALYTNSTGTGNTANGMSSLFFNTGNNNTADGFQSLFANSSGSNNTASGKDALSANTTGVNNTAIGFQSLNANVSGVDNTAVGHSALIGNTGTNNIGIGFTGGALLTTGNNNIAIGAGGVAGESATIRIGNGSQNRAFLAGVRGVTTGAADGLTVVIDSNGQLGTVSSSAAVKRDIASIGDDSAALLKLRPVSFFYRNDTVGIRQYGLIAEEVATVMADLVQFSPGGQPETVRYHFLTPLLLSEVQKEHRTIEEQQKAIASLTAARDEQQKTIDSLNAMLNAVGKRLEGLEKQIGAKRVR
jgi:hypothetical protein